MPARIEFLVFNTSGTWLYYSPGLLHNIITQKHPQRVKFILENYTLVRPNKK
jgi:hypothetical protein